MRRPTPPTPSGGDNNSTRPSPPTQINLDNSLISWDPARAGGRASSSTQAENRRKIRAQASRSSATQRKATIAGRVQRQPQQIRTPPITPDGGPDAIPLRAERLHAALVDFSLRATDSSNKPAHVDFQECVGVIEALESRRNWLARALKETSLAQTSIRTDMRTAMTISPALFQAALFISGTFSNSCGLSYTDVKLGVGMAFMRGASLEAVRNALTASEGEHWVFMAIALLAGWELRFGERDFYETHMKAYRSIFGASIGLQEQNTATIRDFAFETLREQLNDLSLSAPARSSRPSEVWSIPSGFNVFAPALAPEVKSLLSIARDLTIYDPTPPASLPIIRNLGLKALAWTPHHAESFEPTSTFEAFWEPAELNALLHVRAAFLGIIALNSHICHTTHKAKTYLDIMGAADVHAASCAHLRTDALIGTKYQYAAVWTRMTLAAISRDPSRDSWLAKWLKAIDIKTWDGLRGLMEAHMLRDEFLPQLRTVFDGVAQEMERQ